MGVAPNIRHDQFPKQRESELGTSVMVCFAHDTDHQVGGTIVRYDMEEPWREIIRLDDCIPNTEIPRFVETSECMWRPLREPNLGDTAYIDQREEETT